jgi:hypothetical protein
MRIMHSQLQMHTLTFPPVGSSKRRLRAVVMKILPAHMHGLCYMECWLNAASLPGIKKAPFILTMSVTVHM